jgi:hypothetical protein
MSKADEIEEKIKEKRTLEANQRGIMGQNGKIGTILKNLGQPIISQNQGGSFIESNYINLDGNYEYDNIENCADARELMRKIPIMDLDLNERPNSAEWDDQMNQKTNFTTNIIGMNFDGLTRGMHLEITYKEYEAELIVYFQGNVVYKESKGELISYIPSENWHKLIESLYKIAKEKQRNNKEKEFEENLLKQENKKRNWINQIAKNWGFN